MAASVYITSSPDCLLLCCKAQTLHMVESGTRIQPSDILEDIPDEIIDTDINCIKDFFIMAAWEKLKDTG